jgi:hypothetical protein
MDKTAIEKLKRYKSQANHQILAQQIQRAKAVFSQVTCYMLLLAPKFLPFLQPFY